MSQCAAAASSSGGETREDISEATLQKFSSTELNV